ncbi:MAG: hypothetical protein NTZ98_05395 [Acidobacteria bacterium]|nr:hypothetical protein [Acidobacteriota bacterium]
MRTFAVASVLIAVVSAGVSVQRALAQQALAAAPQAQAGGNQAAPSLPVDEIIRKFAAREKEFKLARDNYTYRQTVKVQELSDDGRPGGSYEMVSDIIFTPQHKRIERVVFAPQNTLRRISISPEDDRDLRDIQPFVLTSDDIEKYNVRYLGRQRVDEIDTYVFFVSPKGIEKGQRYFEGQIWVDDRDLQIVKSYGKAVPDIRGKGGSENLFPRFETYREQIDGKYWFPTYTKAEDTLHFSTGGQRIRMIVTYKDYKYFGAESTIKYEGVTDQPQQKVPPKKP